jgi:alginate O-acetyltransferase complex protein AlgI
MAITFFIVVTGWVFFRIENVSSALLYLSRMFSFEFTGTSNVKADPEFYTFLGMAVLFAFLVSTQTGQSLHDAVFAYKYNKRKHTIMFAVSVVLFILSVSSITAFGFNPFIYFRF